MQVSTPYNGPHQSQLAARKDVQIQGLPNYVANSFRTLGCSSSGPKALVMFKVTANL